MPLFSVCIFCGECEYKSVYNEDTIKPIMKHNLDVMKTQYIPLIHWLLYSSNLDFDFNLVKLWYVNSFEKTSTFGHGFLLGDTPFLRAIVSN